MSVAGTGADARLAEVGRALADRAAAVLPPWAAARAVEVVRVGGGSGELAERAGAAAGAAAAAACEVLGRLAEADVDAQRTTPLAALRDACAPVTALLRDAGLPVTGPAAGTSPGTPTDPYGLAPPSWAAVDPELAELALAWGAAKAAAHLSRHRPR